MKTIEIEIIINEINSKIEENEKYPEDTRDMSLSAEQTGENEAYRNIKRFILKQSKIN